MSESLIVFFSQPGETYVNGEIVVRDPGNTKVVAGILAEETGAETFEIVPKTPYPFEYRGQVERAKEEIRNNLRPEPAAFPNLSGYGDVYLLYPNWCGTIPMIVATVLERGNWSGKTIRPLCTNEGSGMGKSEKDIAKLAKGAELAKGLSIHGAKAAQSGSLIRKWIAGTD